MIKTIVDHSGAPVSESSWRTYLVLAHTLSGSAKIVGRSALGRLDSEDVERVIKRWYTHIFEIAKVTLVASGLENVSAEKPCVMIGHHVSLLDTPCIVASYPGPVRFISKKELRRVPVFGKAMEDAKIVFVDRQNLEKAILQLEKAKQIVREGYALWVAAEGTRARDGRLRKLKKGPFHIAIELGVPIVPTWLQGTLDVIRPDQWKAQTGQKVHVAYGEPIETAGLTKDDIAPLMERVRKRMLELAKECGAPPDVDALA